LVTLPKFFWTRVLSEVVILLYAGECTPSVDWALVLKKNNNNNNFCTYFLQIKLEVST